MDEHKWLAEQFDWHWPGGYLPIRVIPSRPSGIFEETEDNPFAMASREAHSPMS